MTVEIIIAVGTFIVIPIVICVFLLVHQQDVRIKP